MNRNTDDWQARMAAIPSLTPEQYEQTLNPQDDEVERVLSEEIAKIAKAIRDSWHGPRRPEMIKIGR